MAKKPSSDLLRIPPHSAEAEQSLLGSLMLDKDAVIRVADSVKPGDFYKDAHNIVYETMLDLYEQHEPIDVLSVGNRLEEKNQIDSIGGSSYLATLVNAVPSASNVAHYARLVQRKATLRRLISAGQDITEMGYDESEDIQKVLDEAEQRIFKVSQKYVKQEFVPIRSVLETAFERIDELHRNKGAMRGIPTNYPDLDAILAGLQKSDLIILAARPSVGKTTFALDLARQIGVYSKVPVGLFSLEMGADQLVDRMIAAQSTDPGIDASMQGVGLSNLRTGKLTDGDFEKIGPAIGVLSEAPIYIDDTGSVNIMEMRTMARRLQAEHHLGLIIIDYLQLMEGRSNREENRVQEISQISRGLKQLARELDIPIIALSQLSRAVENRQDQVPKLSDLRESGSIEQDADVVLFLYREDRVKPDTPNKNIVDVIIAKHRNGPVGRIQLYFQEHSTTFKSLERIHTDQQ